MSNFTLREYQINIVKEVKKKLRENKICIMCLEVRTGKTHIGLDVANEYNNVLFVAKKKL